MGRKLYVGNLGYDVDASALEELFSAHGKVAGARIITDRNTGKSKGFGFVEMSSDSEAIAAIDAMNSQLHVGRRDVGRGGKPLGQIQNLKAKAGDTAFSKLHSKHYIDDSVEFADPIVVFDDPAEQAVAKESSLAENLVASVEKTDSSDIVKLCETYHLKRSDLGRLTGFSLRALAEWSAGKLPSEPARRRLHEVRRLLDALAEIVKIEAIPKWLRERTPAFENMTPLQVIELGEIDRLWHMVYRLGSGNPD